jgi:hypothetical protein
MAKDENCSTGNGNGHNFAIKKSHITMTLAIVAATLAVLGWAKANFADASEFSKFKTEMKVSVALLDLRIQKTALEARMMQLEDKLFESKQKQNPTSSEIVVMERLQRELDRVGSAVSNIDRQIDSLSQFQRTSGQ